MQFKVGGLYTRAELRKQLGLAEKGGDFDTGYSRVNNAFFVFCNVGSAGRTGHDYSNHFDGEDLLWSAKTGTTVEKPQIRALVSGGSDVHVFYRRDDRDPFTYAGKGTATDMQNTAPVRLRWVFNADRSDLPNEIRDGTVFEGAKKQITVNAYERDRDARLRCIRRWKAQCIVCTFDFARVYGALGDGYIHVHHLRPLSEIGTEYTLDPENDLRPVCPNCHAMLHRRIPALSIEELREILRTQSLAR